jgi:hypothetical protein
MPWRNELSAIPRFRENVFPFGFSDLADISGFFFLSGKKFSH